MLTFINIFKAVEGYKQVTIYVNVLFAVSFHVFLLFIGIMSWVEFVDNFTYIFQRDWKFYLN